jgi:exopolysaccharide biosynthesis WecB/TagA/CpsF family protein
MNKPSLHRRDYAIGADIVESATPPPHQDFLGLRFCLASQRGVVRHIINDCAGPCRYIVTPNAYDVVLAHDNGGALLPIYRDAWLSLCDSRIVHALARLDGHHLPLTPGSDLVAALLEALNNSTGPRRRLLVVGPPQAVATALHARYPNIAADVLPAPAGLAQDGAARLAVARACVARDWDILLLCVGGPAQQMIAHQIAGLGRSTGIALCVGAAIDFVTGRNVRAPRWMQRLGLEWAYRLLREPKRLWRRYLIESPKVFRIFWRTRGAVRRRQ